MSGLKVYIPKTKDVFFMPHKEIKLVIGSMTILSTGKGPKRTPENSSIFNQAQIFIEGIQIPSVATLQEPHDTVAIVIKKKPRCKS